MNRKLLALATVYAGLALIGSGMEPDNSNYRGSKEPEPTKIPDWKKEELKIKQGLSKFFYGNHSVWALNKKSADKKALKNGWI